MNDLPNGIRFKLASERAPDFVKGKLSIKRDEFIEWLQQQETGWVNLDLLVSKSGNPYCKVNDYKPKETPQVNVEEDFEIPGEYDL